MTKSQVSDPHVIPDDDGYTLIRYIKAEERQYGALRFTYRPVCSIRRAKFRDGRRDGETEEGNLRRAAAATATRINEWNAKGVDGQVLAINAESILQLHPTLQARLMNIVIYSIEGGDPDPERADVKRDAPGGESDPFGYKNDDELLDASRKNS